MAEAHMNDTQASPRTPLVGQEILVGNVPFRVIGVMAPKPAPFPEDDVNNQVIVPVGAEERRTPACQ